MKKNIIIYSDHSKGHLIPIFYIAKQLEDNGYKVYYVGIEETVKEVEKLGFQFLCNIQKMKILERSRIH